MEQNRRFANTWQQDLLLLSKYHYGPLNDQTIFEALSRLIQAQYLMISEQASDPKTMLILLMQTLLKMDPDYFHGHRERVLFEILEKTAEDPKKGVLVVFHQFASTTVGYLKSLKIELPPICPNMQAYLSEVPEPAEAEPA